MRQGTINTHVRSTTKLVNQICETLTPIHLTPHEEHALFYDRANNPSPQIDWAIMIQYGPLHQWVQKKIMSQLKNMNMAHTIKNDDVNNSIWAEIFDQARLFDPSKNIKYITYVSRGLNESILKQLLQQHFFIRIKHPKIRTIIRLFSHITGESQQDIQQARKNIIERVLGRAPGEDEIRWLNLLYNARNPSRLMDITPDRPPIYTYRKHSPEHVHKDQTMHMEQIEQQHHQDNIMRHVHDILHTGVAQKKFSKRNAQIYKGIMFCENSLTEGAQKHDLTRQRTHQIVQQINHIIHQELKNRGIKFEAE